MKIDSVELLLLRLPYVHFFETSFGREYDRPFILVKVRAEGLTGWGECVASGEPLYSEETTETEWHVLKDFLIPALFRGQSSDPEAFCRAVRPFRGNPMAKAGLELALWDLTAKERGVPLRKLYGGTRDEIPAGVSVGIEDTLDDLTARVEGYLGEGYRRIKIKIKPGWDVEACAAVRRRFPDILLQVDANGAYTLADAETLRRLDAFNLLLVEQPFAPFDLWDHSRLQKMMTSPLCLDESILGVTTARQALEMESCRIINIKVGRVGGPVEARGVHDLCRERGVPVWCGGMLESGIGRAHNLHLASLPNFTLPADLSASKRYYHQDLIDPEVELTGRGTVVVPDGPGIGVNPVERRIRRATLRRRVFKP
ncbi:MAG: o-succinylbenzoate synthase [Candidatus Aminicenantes bacterium RBG_13_63_10]|nr:MAG: o-succinylbenzoate synthase [Candidatus Aminicenantes bacterium RBG_13_63_10]